MSLLERVLEVLCRSGGGGVRGLAELLGVSVEEVRRVIYALVSEGILQVVGGSSACSACPLRRICSGSSGGGGGVAAYVLTEKGRSICRERGFGER